MDYSIFLDKVITEIENGNFRNAIQHCNEFLQKYPKNRSAYEIRSGCHFALGDYDSAISDITYSIEKVNSYRDTNDEIIKLYNERGKIYLEKGDWLKASEDFKNVLILNQNLPETQNNLAVCYRRMNNYIDALYHSSQAIKLNNKSAEAYNNRASINISLGKYHEAIADYSRSIELNPLKANVYFNRGCIYYDMLNNKENAIQDFLKAISINPNFKEELKVHYTDLIDNFKNKQAPKAEEIVFEKNISGDTIIPEEVVSEKEEEIITEESIVSGTIIPEEVVYKKEEEIIPEESIVSDTIIPEEVFPKQDDTSIDFSIEDFDYLFNDKPESAPSSIEESVSSSAQEDNKSDEIIVPDFDLKSMFADLKDSEIIPNLEEESSLSDRPVITDDIKTLHDEIQAAGEDSKGPSGLMSGINFGEMSAFEKPIVDSEPGNNYISYGAEEKKSFLKSPLFFIILIFILVIIILFSVLNFFNSQYNQIVNNPVEVKTDSNNVKNSDTLKEENKDTVTQKESGTDVESAKKPDEEIKQENVTNKDTKPEAELTIKNLGYISDKKQFVLFSEPDGYYVQIGSYKEIEKANYKLKLLEKNNIKGKVTEVDLKEKGIFYRVRAGVFSTPEEAKEKTVKIE